jgi:hypothetical protein
MRERTDVALAGLVRLRLLGEELEGVIRESNAGSNRITITAGSVSFGAVDCTDEASAVAAIGNECAMIAKALSCECGEGSEPVRLNWGKLVPQLEAGDE